MKHKILFLIIFIMIFSLNSFCSSKSEITINNGNKNDDREVPEDIAYDDYINDCVIFFEAEKDNKLKTDEIGCVELTAKSGTGYEWNYSISEEGILKYEASKIFVTDENPGAKYKKVWKLKGVKNGITNISFDLYRPDDGVENSIENISYTVIVE